MNFNILKLLHMRIFTFILSLLLSLLIVFTISCKKEDTDITAGMLPFAAFNADTTSIFLGHSIQFTDQSRYTPTYWLWNFGNGDSSTQQNPLYTFTSAGVFSVSLTVTNDNGSDTKTRTDFITVIDSLTILTDYEGNIYNIDTIGEKIWMAENLRATKYNDGTDITLVTDNSTWGNYSSPAYCWFNNNSAYSQTLGALYNGYVVNTGKLCPTGWHVSTHDEWTAVVDFLGGEDIIHGKIIEPEKSDFFMPLGSVRWAGDGLFFDSSDRSYGSWWTSTEYSSTLNYILFYNSGGVRWDKYVMQAGQSVRCVKD